MSSRRHRILSVLALMLLAACGGGGGSEPTGPAGVSILMKVAPDTLTMGRSQPKVFHASPLSGTLPAGAKLVWAVLGAGKTSAAAGDSVTYTSPAADGVDTLTVQVLDASGTPKGGGAAVVRIASGAGLTFSLTPTAPYVEAQAGAGTQRFVMSSSTGLVPAGYSFTWTITGSSSLTGAFSLTNTKTATTTANNITYVSPLTSSATTDTLKVEVRNGSGTLVSSASTPVRIFPGLTWSITGANPNFAIYNGQVGSYVSPGGGLGRVDANFPGGVQQLACAFKFIAPTRPFAMPDVTFTFYIPRGTRAAKGNVFTQGETVSTAAGALQTVFTGIAGATLTITDVVQQSDGSDFITFTFATSGNTAGYTGSASGSGQCILRYP